MQLSDVFVGYDGAHGKYSVGQRGVKGKMEGQAVTVVGPASEKEWEEHIDGGKYGLGIIPLLRSNTVRFAAIDVDKYDLDLTDVAAKINARPLVICRSKSGGAHLYLFLSEEAPATVVVDIMSRWAAEMGYGGAEIFPKQTTRLSERDIGNWINTSYFNAKDTERYCWHDGAKLSLDEFLNLVEQKRLTYDQLLVYAEENTKRKSAKDDLFEEAPPCLVQLRAAGGFPPGTRNEGLFAVGVYLRKRYAEDWKNYFEAYNREMCNPPLTVAEMRGLIASLSKKEYQYKCDQSPIKEHCNKRLCYARLYGVGATNDGDGLVQIGSVIKYEGDPVLWRIDINGQSVLIDTETLYSQPSFNKLCMERINRVPGQVPTPRWLRRLDDLLRSATTIKSPEDASPKGQFHLLYEQFINGRVQARRIEELLMDKPWNDRAQKRVFFQSRSLFKYLDDQRYKLPSEHYAWQMLSQEPFNVKSELVNIGGTEYPTWSTAAVGASSHGVTNPIVEPKDIF